MTGRIYVSMTRIKEWYNSNYLYFTFFVICMYFCWRFHSRQSDSEVIYAEFVAKYGSYTVANVFGWIKDRFIADFGWSSRQIINFFASIFLLFPRLWGICNALLCTLAGWSIGKLFNFKGIEFQVLALLSVFIYNHWITFSAGWLLGTIAYTWSSYMVLIAAQILWNRGYEKNRLQYSILLLCVAYAANEELTAIGLFFILPVVAWAKRDCARMVCLLQTIVVLEIIWVAFCPGNRSRLSAETGRWFPEFAKFSILQKMQLGFSVTMGKIWLAASV